jgi:hypothetical protein
MSANTTLDYPRINIDYPKRKTFVERLREEISELFAWIYWCAEG